MKLDKFKIVIFLCLSLSLNVSASLEDYYPKKLEPTSSNSGITGILEMPNARFMDEGSMKIGFSSSYPNEYTYISATPFSWLEASYKYTEQKNLKYGPSSYSGNQTLKDKGFDLKIRLLKESYFIPEVAIGWNDLAGTGRFAAEYISATKKIKNADVTIGYGWGALGQNQNVRNPLLSISEDFKYRNNTSGQGGTFNSKTWFSGEEISIYSGVEYYLQRYGLILKVEYDTSNPDLGYSGPKLPVESRFNVGISRPVNSNLDLGLSFERGNQLRFSFAIKSDYGKRPLVQKRDPPKNIIKLNKDQRVIVAENKNIFYGSLNRSLREESILIQAATLSSDTVEVVIAQNRFRSLPRAVGRTVRMVSALSPESVSKIRVIPMNGDIELYAIEVSKENFDKLDNGRISSVELFNTSKALAVDPYSYSRSDFKPIVKFPELFFNMSPSLRHQIGGPEAFYLGQLWWKINAKVKFKRGLTLHTVLGLNIYNNFNEFSNPSYSNIPHVRSDIQEYLSEGENNIARLKVDYLWSPRKDIFIRLDAGYLEEMFGGVGGEVYYRPFKSNFSTSLQLHKVKQRDYKQRFDFRDYEVETGHLGFYYDFPKGISAQLLVGKYLAGDKGATVDFSRRFKNGFTLGVFATKTDLSSVEFGEGSFDKGFYFSIPTDSFFTNFRQGDISFGLHPLTKDGGAALNHMNSLYSLFGNTQYRSILRDWKDINE